MQMLPSQEAAQCRGWMLPANLDMAEAREDDTLPNLVATRDGVVFMKQDVTGLQSFRNLGCILYHAAIMHGL